MRGFVGIVVLAACSARGGVVVRVDPGGVAVDDIRLFLAAGAGSNAPLQPPTAWRLPSQGVPYWGRDPANADDQVAASHARFVFASDDTAATYPALIAVGYRARVPVAAAAMLDAQIPSSSFDVYTLTLSPPVPSTSVPPGLPSDPFDFQVWSPTTDASPEAAACVAVEDNRTPAIYPSAFIVTPGDRDCDGISDDDPLECDADVYRASRPPDRAELSCTTLTPTTMASCVLGGPACTDGMARDPTECLATRYCATKPLCSACAGIACASDISPLAPTSRPYHLACALPTRDDGSFCAPSVAVPAWTNALGCTDAAIRDVEQGFGTTLDHVLGNGAGRIKLKLTRAGTSCALTLETQGNVMVPRSIGALLALDLDNGRGAAIPMLLQISKGCGQGPTCSYVDTPGDSGTDLTSCVGIP